MPSRHFNALKKNHDVLKNEFLNFKRRTDGQYTKRELLQCRAYQSFVHAEIEYYLEQMALSAIARAQEAWRKKGRVGRLIGALLTYVVEKKIPITDDPENASGSNKLETIVQTAFVKQRNIIEGNNGIKRKNLSRLFIPLGLNPDDIPPVLMTQLDLLGGDRGTMVHKASHVSLTQIRDPFADVESDISALLVELESFDELLRKLA